jgi:hypothetical protein
MFNWVCVRQFYDAVVNDEFIYAIITSNDNGRYSLGILFGELPDRQIQKVCSMSLRLESAYK